jgi:DNA transposition AAA+ family ATPase
MIATSSTTPASPAVKFNEALRQRLLELRAGPAKENYSNNKLAKALGVNSSYVSQYCTGEKFSGDLDNFEKRLADFFRNEARRKASGVDTVSSSESKQLADALEFIRKTNDVGEILAHSGEGKSRGIELYKKTNPTCIVFHVRSWSRDLGSIEGALFKAIGSAGWDKTSKRAEFMCDKLAGSDRLLIVDDAHKLTKPAMQWLFDFHDVTQSPVALVGTFDLEANLGADSQRFSRTGLRYEIKPEEPRALIEHLVRSLAPDLNGEFEQVCDLGEQIAAHAGCYRAVHKQLKLAMEIRSSAKKPITMVQAVRSAQTQLIRDWQLS